MKGNFLILVCAFALTSATNNIKAPELNEVGCPKDVTIDWFLPHETLCDSYYMCVIGTPIVMNCSPYTAFSIEKTVCDWIDQVDCGDRALSVEENKTDRVEEQTTAKPLFGYDDPSQVDEICAKEGSDNKMISHQDCNKYYQCVWGSYIVRQCPTNLYYNPKNGQCDWQVNVDCTNVVAIHPDWSEAEKECSKGSALVPHEYCDWFYQCTPQGPVEKRCGAKTVFDYELQTCNWPIFVNCGDKTLRPEESKEEESKEEESKEEESKEEKSKEEETVPDSEGPVTEPESDEVDDVIVELPDIIG